MKLINLPTPPRTYSEKEYTEMEELMMEWRGDCNKHRNRCRTIAYMDIFQRVKFMLLGKKYLKDLLNVQKQKDGS